MFTFIEKCFVEAIYYGSIQRESMALSLHYAWAELSYVAEAIKKNR